MNRYLMPIKREIWEHNGSFIKAPIVIFALLCISLFAAIALGRAADFNHGFHYEVNAQAQSDSGNVRQFEYNDVVIGEQASDAEHTGVAGLPISEKDIDEGVGVANIISYIVFGSILLLIAASYLLGSLYSDRKDGSILFWKSMPVSETQNVLTKVVVATCVLPIIAWGCALVFSVVLWIAAAIVALMIGQEGALALVFREQAILSAAWQYLGTFIAVSLLLLPVIAFLLLASAIAKKTPFLFAVVPIIAALIIERIVFGTRIVPSIIKDYLGLELPGTASSMVFSPSWWNIWHVLSSAQFWLGAAVAAVMLCAAVWLRENRYEQ
ncbi:MAG TPA: hypothetical protein VIC26_13685 [Marinagarivorans sp.]